MTAAGARLGEGNDRLRFGLAHKSVTASRLGRTASPPAVADGQHGESRGLTASTSTVVVLRWSHQHVARCTREAQARLVEPADGSWTLLPRRWVRPAADAPSSHKRGCPTIISGMALTCAPGLEPLSRQPRPSPCPRQPVCSPEPHCAPRPIPAAPAVIPWTSKSSLRTAAVLAAAQTGAAPGSPYRSALARSILMLKADLNVRSGGFAGRGALMSRRRCDSPAGARR